MQDGSHQVVGDEGAALAPLVPSGVEHEVVDDKLAPALEQIAEGAAAVRTVEEVVLVDQHPWQFAALPAQFVSFPGEFLFGGKMLQTRLQPFVSRNHFVLSLCCSHWI